jgi:hypothetical protein
VTIQLGDDTVFCLIHEVLDGYVVFTVENIFTEEKRRFNTKISQMFLFAFESFFVK